jgi:hypothetical protein
MLRRMASRHRALWVQRGFGALALGSTLLACSTDKGGPVVAPADLNNPPQCPIYDTGTELGALADKRLSEVSGIVASRAHPGTYWVHNDSGDSARIFAIRSDASLVREIELTRAQAVDWEDIAIGSLQGGAPVLFVGDIGDNDAVRASVSVYRIAEPDPAQPATASVGAERFEITYPDGPKNAEALLFDDVSKHGFVVTKAKDGNSIVYDFGDLSGAGVPRAAVEVARLQFGAAPLAGSPLVTGGALTQNLLVLRTYTRAYQWLRTPGETLQATLQRPACALPVASEPQGEAIGLDAAGNYVTLSESKGATLWKFTRLK